MNIKFESYVSENHRRLQQKDLEKRLEQDRVLSRNHHQGHILARLTDGVRLLAQISQIRVQVSFDLREPQPDAAGGC